MAKFYTITRFNLYRNGRGCERHQRMYKTKKRFETLLEAKQYAKKYFGNKSCICIQIDIEDDYGTLDTVVEKVRGENEHNR